MNRNWEQKSTTDEKIRERLQRKCKKKERKICDFCQSPAGFLFTLQVQIIYNRTKYRKISGKLNQGKDGLYGGTEQD